MIRARDYTTTGATIPRELADDLDRYVDLHVLPACSVTRAAIRNDALGMLCSGTAYSAPTLRAIVLWLHNEAPAACHGSADAVTAWLAVRQ